MKLKNESFLIFETGGSSVLIENNFSYSHET